jgi:hypothetical protein
MRKRARRPHTAATTRPATDAIRGTRPNSAGHQRRRSRPRSTTSISSRKLRSNRPGPPIKPSGTVVDTSNYILRYKGPSLGVLLNSPRSRALLAPNFAGFPTELLNMRLRTRKRTTKQWSSGSASSNPPTARRPISAPSTRRRNGNGNGRRVYVRPSTAATTTTTSYNSNTTGTVPTKRRRPSTARTYSPRSSSSPRSPRSPRSNDVLNNDSKY